MEKSLRESALSEILDTIDDIGKRFDDTTGGSSRQRKSNTSLNVSSISKASKDLIMSFPVLCDNSLDPRTAAMICKAVERKAVTMLQMIFASCSFNGDNGREILAQWHRNLEDTTKLTLDDYLSLCDKLSESCDSVSDRRAINEATRLIKIEMKNSDKIYPPSSFSESSINDYMVSSRHGNNVVLEKRTTTYKSDYNADGSLKGTSISSTDDGETDYDEDMRRGKARYDYEKARYDRNLSANKARDYDSDRNRQIRNQDADYNLKQNQLKDYEDNRQRQNNRMNVQNAKDMSSIASDNTSFLRQQLLDTDVKKCNELVPSLMIVRFNSGKDGETKITNQFVAGVKARLIAVDSAEIINRVYTKNKDKAGLVNLIRATTKEISFVKDYLLAIDKAKLDAKNNSVRNKTSRIWKTLERRSTRSVYKRLRSKTNDAGCITTLVISEQAVNILKKEYNTDLTKLKTAATIMDAYNLLCLCIVDESTEVARFLYDGDTSYESLSFTSLEREQSDSSYKKVINLLSKMN